MGEVIISGNIMPYKFLGEEYTNRSMLVSALAEHWNDGKKQLFRGLLSAHFKRFDAEIAGFCIDAEEEIKNGNEDIIFFKTLYKIDSSMTRFFWKEKEYKNLSEIGNELLEALWTGNNLMDMDKLIDELLQKGILSQYLISIGTLDMKKIDSIKAIESSYRISKNSSRKKTMNLYLLAYMLSEKKILYKMGVKFNNIQELTIFLEDSLKHSYNEFQKICHELIDYDNNLDPQFESWLLALGKENEIEQWRNNL